MLERAAELDRLARSEEALQLLEGCGDWPVPYNERGLLLRANIFAVRDPIAALDELPEDAAVFTTDDRRVGYLLASARAYIGTRNWRAAAAMLRAAEGIISDTTDPARFRLAFLRARIHWSLREYNPDDPDLALTIQSPDIPLRFHSINLRSWMRGGLEDHRGQMEDLLECLDLYRRFPDECEIRSVAIALRSTLGFAWEMADFQACDVAVETFNAIPWVREIEVQRFLCLRGLTWQALLRGDLVSVRKYSDEALSTAPSLPLKTLAHADRAYIAAVVSDSSTEMAELQRAQSIADGVEWETTRDDEREVLLMLAVLLAPNDTTAAQRYMAAHYSLHEHGRRENLDGARKSRRHYALEKYADGLIQHFLGKDIIAIRLLEDAHDIFVASSHVFRAMLAAKALFQITHDQRWLGAARLHAASFPNSVVSRHLYA